VEGHDHWHALCRRDPDHRRGERGEEVVDVDDIRAISPDKLADGRRAPGVPDSPRPGAQGIKYPTDRGFKHMHIEARLLKQPRLVGDHGVLSRGDPRAIAGVGDENPHGKVLSSSGREGHGRR
jgi:hypothetical protein